MRILLDTHLLLWAMAASRKLPRAVKTQLLDPANEIYYSAASLWEIAIKRGLRREDFRIDLDALMAALRESGFRERRSPRRTPSASRNCPRSTRTRSTACWSRRAWPSR